MTIRLFAAMLGGGMIGFEREWGNHHAGLRTHMLVALGAALIMLLSMYGFSQFAEEPNVRMDPARLGAQVISGIGFLGAGTIIRNGLSVSGLTTAASLWVSAAIGLSAGAGFYFVTALATVLMMITLLALNGLGKRVIPSRTTKTLHIVVEDAPGMLKQISHALDTPNVKLGYLNVESMDDGMLGIRISYRTKKQNLFLITETIKLIPGVKSVGNYKEASL
ncbi:MgtC/SapB family protein [Paenibacillus filicis]|uniref:MgtC/SapB family protein n=1 Tax=Paenibacillus filicis TaxID=669464 RepID=A0ABU9DIP8_9BACL